MRKDKQEEDVYKKLLEERIQKKNARLILEGLIPTMGLGRLTPHSPWLFPDKKLEEGSNTYCHGKWRRTAKTGKVSSEE